MWVENQGSKQVLRLDIGSESGLKPGGLLSVGGIGDQCSVWRVTTARKYSSTAERAEHSPPGGATRGDRIYQVEADAQK